MLGPGWGSTSPALSSVSRIIAAATSLFIVTIVSVAQLAAIVMTALRVLWLRGISLFAYGSRVSCRSPTCFHTAALTCSRTRPSLPSCSTLWPIFANVSRACRHSFVTLAIHAFAAGITIVCIVQPRSAITVLRSRGSISVWVIVPVMCAIHPAAQAIVMHVSLVVLAVRLLASRPVSHRGWCSVFTARVAALLHSAYIMACVVSLARPPSASSVSKLVPNNFPKLRNPEASDYALRNRSLWTSRFTTKNLKTEC